MRPGFAGGRRQAHEELWMEPIGGGVPWCSSSQLESTWLLPSVQDEVVMATDSHLFSSSPGPHTAQHPYPAPALRGVTETGALPAESHLPICSRLPLSPPPAPKVGAGRPDLAASTLLPACGTQKLSFFDSDSSTHFLRETKVELPCGAGPAAGVDSCAGPSFLPSILLPYSLLVVLAWDLRTKREAPFEWAWRKHRMHGRRPSPKGETPTAECLQAKIRMGEQSDLLFDCLCLGLEENNTGSLERVLIAANVYWAFAQFLPSFLHSCVQPVFFCC